MIDLLQEDIAAQPSALRSLIDFYRTDGSAVINAISVSTDPLLTGMGASYHAAAMAALYWQSFGRAVFALEATDLLNYSGSLIKAGQPLIFVSQSGSSGEVAPITDQTTADIVAVTNNADSPLAARARHVLPILAGSEALVATKTFVNSYVVLWLLARHWIGIGSDNDFTPLMQICDRIERLLAIPDLAAQWLNLADQVDTLIFAGHGPHYWTARHAAMMAGEWAKVPVMSTSIGAFRHGLIESVSPRTGLVLFSAPGTAQRSTLKLVDELTAHGVPVLLVSDGLTYKSGETISDLTIGGEFLSPILNTIAAQRFIQALPAQLGVVPGFRFISKVVTQL